MSRLGRLGQGDVAGVVTHGSISVSVEVVVDRPATPASALRSRSNASLLLSLTMAADPAESLIVLASRARARPGSDDTAEVPDSSVTARAGDQPSSSSQAAPSS